MSDAYAELHCLTNFTFLRGASHPDELVERAAELGYAALAITDECSLAGVVRAHLAAKQHGLHLIIGSEVTLVGGLKLVLLATDRDGYGNLAALITRGRRRAEKGAYRLSRADLADGLPGCLVLWPPDVGRSHEDEGRWLAATFPGRAWIAVELHCGTDDAARLVQLQALAASSGLPLAATGDVHMHRRGRRALQDLLTATRLGVTIAEAGAALHPNGERHLRPIQRLARLYPPELLAESVAVAARCRFNLDELKYNYPEEAVPPGETPTSHLRRLTETGLKHYWPAGEPAKVRQLVEHELRVIAELGYEAYFLTVHDLVQYARLRGILCQGRGSAANSAVCYCLGITAVDPSRSEMLFERFISKERGEPPDIDVDFEHQRREEVIQYLYQRYGRERAAIAATVITYRPKSALRDVGKALGLSPHDVDRLAGTFAWWDRRSEMEKRLAEAGFDAEAPVIKRLLTLTRELLGFPRHLSQHVGGMVITRDPLCRLVPLENAAMPTGRAGALGHDEASDALAAARTVLQWDKDDLDALGLLKIDCLALGMLSAIHRAFDLVTRHRGYPLSLDTVPAEDPAVYAMIAKADTVGVFQIESRAQMAMLPRLKPETFYDLVIEVAIIRPGPIQGDMVHPYLRRRQGLEAVTYPGPEARAVLERTLGVPIFQEQVIKLAMVAAGFSPGEADQLRRAMAAWRRKGTLDHFEEKLRRGMAERNYPAEFAAQIIEQLKGFGEYGFPESHAASFALIAYVSAWLKCHEPAAFTCALLNSQPMGFYAPAQLVRDARDHGVEVRPVDVQASEWDCKLEEASRSPLWERRPRRDSGALAPVVGASSLVGSTSTAHRSRVVEGEAIKRGGNGWGLALRLGLRMIKGLKKAAAERLVTARAEGPFRSVADLAYRARLSTADLERLTAAGALEGLAGDRHSARWAVLGTDTTLPLFGEAHFAEAPPALPTPTEGQDLVADYAHTGLSLRSHPLALLRETLKRRRYVAAREANARRNGSPVRFAGLVITRQRPGDGRTTFLTLEDETGIANIIIWERLGERYRKAILGGRLLGIFGQVQSEAGVVHIVARHIEDHTPLLGALSTQSRDFC